MNWPNMRFIILLLVYAHIFIFANSTFSLSAESSDFTMKGQKGEMKKFFLHSQPISIDKLPVLQGDNTEFDLMKQGYNVILVNFWATWCRPCVEEMPSLDKLQSLFDPHKIKIITIATGRNNQKTITNFFSKHMIVNLENFRDPKGSLATKLGIFGLPASIIISPDGNEIGRLIGPIDWIEADVVEFFESLLL